MVESARNASTYHKNNFEMIHVTSSDRLEMQFQKKANLRLFIGLNLTTHLNYFETIICYNVTFKEIMKYFMSSHITIKKFSFLIGGLNLLHPAR